MPKTSVFAFGWLAALAIVATVRAQVTTTEIVENGVTYQVTKQTVQRSIPTTEYQTQQQKVYRPQATVQYQTYQQNYVTPVTEYRWVSRLRGWWNPFEGAYWTYELQPVTRWQSTPGTVQIPVTRTDWVEETRTAQVPVTTYRTVNDEITRRVAVSVSPQSRQTNVASRPAYGERLDK